MQRNTVFVTVPNPTITPIKMDQHEWLTLEERRALEGEIVRKCLARNDQQVNLFLFQCDPSNSIVIFGSDLVSISQ